ncbi:MAG: anaerobic ribonucleoside triphosphate reductase [Candidatus Odinarchaeota archaeon]|nr:anaerobic ribonucleoside triphosphate reductase [Candidatus Odinarchaeota archaeon]
MNLNIKELEKMYISEIDWEVHENANTTVSYSDFLGFLMDKILKAHDILSNYLPIEAIKAHLNGDIHIHKLPHSLWIPYCVGWNYSKILKLGLKTPTIVSRPARHLDTAVSHLINFFYLASQEWTGAQAASAIDLYMAPFVKCDNLDYKGLKQNIQKMFFELNYPSRLGYQATFTNVTIVLDTSKEFLEGSAIVDGKNVGSLNEYLDDAIKLTRAIFELTMEGDSLGQPFTFPIITLMLTPNFDWNGHRWDNLVDTIFMSLAYRGSSYLLNGYNSEVGSLYAMCCRLTLDVSKIASLKLLRGEMEDIGELLRKKKSARGIWAMPDATGSIGVVTINLPRIGILSKGSMDKLEEMLFEKIELARKIFLVWREKYEKSLESGLMPMTKVYLGTLASHYNTIGLLGLPEMAANFMQNPNLWHDLESKELREAVSIMKHIVSLTRKIIEEYEEKDGYLYNVEEVPAESTSYRLALLDYNKFKELVSKNEILIPRESKTPYYSNSIIPYYADISLGERVEFEGEVQQEFTGGVMMHIFLNETPDPIALKKLVYRIAVNTKVVYFSITPTIATCRNCGWHGIGIYEKCPKCGKSVDLWSRIVGYYRPIKNWNIGKKAEFKQRVHYGGSKLLA